ncbi:unnamed protein product [Coffea canephora]|uniref:Uncharacterized protein n=1 Tax=Coffea canephora TaxID=49390 RepID=A0A068TUM2_COFCA|nr:unnamed protein product [Coffea canephora]
MVKMVYYIVGLLIMVMDVVAGILGIQAEVAQNKAITLRLWIFECTHPSYEAFKLGMVATLLLTLAHVAAVMLSGCVCIGSKEELDQSSNIKRLAAASHVLAWYEITFIAFCPHTNYNHRLVNNKELRNCLVSEN